ncbi:lysozyme [Gluconobacter cerinus]|uniref:lysozyme n=1 Tax=Gluconobacter cerinus TaxID=38307 RepID=UPI001B8AECFE|nr:lysozyme [Gluconobacter cerinus]MBS0984326.1 lysozyme [Gluconobacter cerinus]
MSIPIELIELVEKYEGFRAQAYQDITGIWTCGYGFTGPDITADTSMTLIEARTELSSRLELIWSAITQKAHSTLSQNELIALSDFAYNLGLNALFTSHLWALLQLSEKQAASEQFPLWCHAGGKEVQGLLTRRLSEQKIFMTE